jgi:hypothetical protein
MATQPELLHIPEDVPAALKEARFCSECGAPVFALPLLRCADCDCELHLRAFVYKKHGKHIAECVDLNLTVQSGTLEGAVVKLQEQVFGYLKVAFDGNPKGLVLRQSPLIHRVRYNLNRFIRYYKNRRNRQQRVWKSAEMPPYHSRICQC